MNASKNQLWEDTRMTFLRDGFCDDCKIVTAQKKKRGSTPTSKAMNVTRAGQAATMDIVPNIVGHGLTVATHSKYFLLICDVYSKFTTLIGMDDASSKTVLQAIATYVATYQTADSKFFTGPMEGIRTDAGSAFMSQEFVKDCTEKRINVSHAAPRHQEMNGLAERSWRSIRDLAFSMIVHAQVGDKYYDFALDHAWKVFNCLPIKGLEKDGKPITPFESFFNVKPSLSNSVSCSVL